MDDNTGTTWQPGISMLPENALYVGGIEIVLSINEDGIECEDFSFSEGMPLSRILGLLALAAQQASVGSGLLSSPLCDPDE